ncbi:hypothetical protein HCU01_33280 [Halomonas cupida]|uniref:Abasic site processing protein n=1 Tax=Halomonas cupida TaxID=44933 RepID=A0A1M7KI89_9GAMM|nr:SOS response-associated peptidase family protein [Halomonas cupida]GEN25379.1 hypothetical protein HCU01_33280 [Halomonas cupida]SHM64950.1 Putative SOS response-associated peptidase YedK [Halomonas cupida]
MIERIAIDLREVPDFLQFSQLKAFEGTVNYNVCPHDHVPAIYNVGSHGPRWERFRWGYQPHDVHGGAIPVNVPAERVVIDEFYRGALAERRCAVPIVGWHEWELVPGGTQPYFFTRSDGHLLLLAGVHVQNTSGQMTLAIITEPPRSRTERPCGRVPLLIAEDSLDAWLDPELVERQDIRKAISRVDLSQVTNWKVSKEILMTRAGDQSLIERVD